MSIRTMTAVLRATSAPNNNYFRSSCSTQLKFVVFEFTWTINDFRRFCNLAGRALIESSIFSDGTTDGLKWRMDVDIHPIDVHSKEFVNYSYEEDYISLNLHQVSSNFQAFKADCQFSILDAKLERIHEQSIIGEFSERDKCTTANLFIEKNALLSKIYDFLPDDSLTLLCEIYILENSENISSEVPPTQDIGLALFENPECSDVTFSDGVRDIQAHMAILSIKSPVFKAMFMHNLEERKSKSVKILDFDCEVVEELLRFIYTNKTSNIDKIAHKLFYAADKYALDELKFISKEAMIRNLSIENAAEYYLVGVQNNAEDLKNRVKSFITSNSSKVIASSGFKTVCQSNPEVFENLHLVELCLHD